VNAVPKPVVLPAAAEANLLTVRAAQLDAIARWASSRLDEFIRAKQEAELQAVNLNRTTALAMRYFHAEDDDEAEPPHISIDVVNYGSVLFHWDFLQGSCRRPRSDTIHRIFGVFKEAELILEYQLAPRPIRVSPETHFKSLVQRLAEVGVCDGAFEWLQHRVLQGESKVF
jgi:hypothetical protein